MQLSLFRSHSRSFYLSIYFPVSPKSVWYASNRKKTQMCKTEDKKEITTWTAVHRNCKIRTNIHTCLRSCSVIPCIIFRIPFHENKFFKCGVVPNVPVGISVAATVFFSPVPTLAPAPIKSISFQTF